MSDFKISLDHTEISFLKTSLEVILDRQLNSIAETNIWLIDNEKKLKSLDEKIKAGKSSIFSNYKNEFDILINKRKSIELKLMQNKSINSRARNIYLSILDQLYYDNPKDKELIKDFNKHKLTEDREIPFKDFYREWEKTFF